MKSWMILFLVFFTGCISVSHKKLLKYPAANFTLSQDILKSNGYYYTEKEWTSYCRKLTGITSGVVADTTTKFFEKYISAFVLYNDGYAYATGSLITTGINRPGATSQFDYCNLVEKYNNHQSAREVFEDHIRKGWIADSKYDKGIYHISNDTIIFQVYQISGPPLEFIEYHCKILNDTSFAIFKKVNYSQKTISASDAKREVYHFKEFPIKPDSTNFLRDKKDKFKKR
jgi:hypothetical protein